MNARLGLPQFLAITAIAAAPLGVLAWRRTRPRSKALGATPVARLGATESTCSPGPGNVRVCLTRPKGPLKVMTTPLDACKILRAAGQADRESFFVVSLDVRNQVLGIEEIAKGPVSGVEVHPREVMKGALLMNASGVVVAHNHPSGDPSPSHEDIQLTKRLVAVGQMIGVPVVDHIVIGDKRCTSIRESYGESLFT